MESYVGVLFIYSVQSVSSLVLLLFMTSDHVCCLHWCSLIRCGRFKSQLESALTIEDFI